MSIEGSDLGAIHLAIAPIVPVGPSDAAVHRFVAAGFGVRDDPTLDRWNRIDKGGAFDELVLHIPWTDPVGDGLARAGEIAGASGRRAVVIVDLPRESESTTFDDDEAVADRVADAARAALSAPNVEVLLDGLMDHDRGYYPRHGLIDRSFNPRTALYRLIEISSARG